MNNAEENRGVVSWKPLWILGALVARMTLKFSYHVKFFRNRLYLEFIFTKNAVLCIPNTRGQWKCTKCRLRNVQCKKKGMSGHASSQWMSTGQATKEAYMHRRIDASFYECLSYFQ